jgi:hypothetical protein
LSREARKARENQRRPGRNAGSNSESREKRRRVKERQTTGTSSNSKPASSSSVGRSGEFVAEAMIIDDADTNNNDFGSRLAEETQRLQQDLETRLQQQQEETRQQEANRLQEKARLQKEYVEEKNNQRHKKRCTVLFVLSLAVIAGVASYFVTQGDNSRTIENDTITEVPLVPVTTISPSSDLIMYEPPSPGTCKSISLGKSVEGQSEMITKCFIVSLEASLRSELDVSLWLSDLKLIMQEKLMPLIVGCPDEERRFLRLRSSDKTMFNRKLAAFDEFVLGNAQIDMNYEIANTCSNGKASCHSFDMKLDISSKDTVEDSSELLPEHITDVMRRKFPLSEYLQVDQIIETLGIRNVEAYIPSEAPSFEPTGTPYLTPTVRSTISASPTLNGQTFPPTEKPSPLPTFAPTLAPTLASTTKSPTPAPVVGPTMPPTPIPTMAPTPSPTFAPLQHMDLKAAEHSLRQFLLLSGFDDECKCNR